MASGGVHTHAYFEVLMKVLETPDKAQSVKGGVKKAGLVTAGMVGGSVMLGPLGALLGGVVAGGKSREMKVQSKTIKKMVKRLRSMTTDQKELLVSRIEDLVGFKETDKLLEYVKEAKNKKKVVNLVKNFMVSELEYRFKEDMWKYPTECSDARMRTRAETWSTGDRLNDNDARQNGGDISKPLLTPRTLKAKTVHFALDVSTTDEPFPDIINSSSTPSISKPLEPDDDPPPLTTAEEIASSPGNSHHISSHSAPISILRSTSDLPPPKPCLSTQKMKMDNSSKLSSSCPVSSPHELNEMLKNMDLTDDNASLKPAHQNEAVIEKDILIIKPSSDVGYETMTFHRKKSSKQGFSEMRQEDAESSQSADNFDVDDYIKMDRKNNKKPSKS